MNFLAWSLALLTMMMALTESVHFFSATICRQKAWLSGTILQTRTLLYGSKTTEQSFDRACHLYVTRKTSITWQRLPGVSNHHFQLPLKGQL
jgi:hypothetical protein